MYPHYKRRLFVFFLVLCLLSFHWLSFYQILILCTHCESNVPRTISCHFSLAHFSPPNHSLSFV